MKTLKITLFSLLISISAKAQDTLSILFAGDIMGHDTQINAAKRGDTYEYDTTFSFLKPLFESHDINIGNLELTLGITPYKGYPQFSSPPELAVSLKKAGFDILVTSNNHTCDRGKKGIENTLLILDTLDLVHTGSFRNHEEKDKYYPLVYRKKGFKLGVLNYTYGTNGLEAAPEDQDGGTGAEWGCYGTNITGADSTTDGAQNTADILAAGCESGNPPAPGGNPVAANLVDAYSLNGYDDWYLPSKDELNSLYSQKAIVGGFASYFYWSSSEFGDNHAEGAYFPGGGQIFTLKHLEYFVRAVRAF